MGRTFIGFKYLAFCLKFLKFYRAKFIIIHIGVSGSVLWQLFRGWSVRGVVNWDSLQNKDFASSSFLTEIANDGVCTEAERVALWLSKPKSVFLKLIQYPHTHHSPFCNTVFGGWGHLIEIGHSFLLSSIVKSFIFPLPDFGTLCTDF